MDKATNNYFEKKWRKLQVGDSITAQELHGSKDAPEIFYDYWKDGRNFMRKKCRQGFALIHPWEGREARYEKLPENMPISLYIKKLFNTLPMFLEITTNEFLYMLPPIYKSRTMVGNFFSTQKRAGCVEIKCDSSGKKIRTDGGCYVYVKKNIVPEKTKYNPRINRTQKKSKILSEVVNANAQDSVKELMSDMTAKDTGNAIFHSIIQLLAENQNLKAEIKMLTQEKESLEEMTLQLDKALNKHKTEHLTFKEMIKHAKRINI